MFLIKPDRLRRSTGDGGEAGNPGAQSRTIRLAANRKIDIAFIVLSILILTFSAAGPDYPFSTYPKKIKYFS